MTINLWHYNIKQRLGKLASNDKIDLNPAELDEEINRGITSWVRDTIAKGLESTETINQKLSTLVTSEMLTTADNVDPVINTYEFRFSNLSYPVFHIMRVSADLVQGDCVKNQQDLYFTQVDDLSHKLGDPYQGPSLDWGRALYTVQKDSFALGRKSIHVWTEGLFSVSNVRIIYIKRPEIVSIGGYNDINGSPKFTVESDLPEETHNEVIDSIVENIAINLNDPATQLYSYAYKKNQ